MMQKNNLKIFFYYQDGNDWEDGTEFDLYTIFQLLAPEMMIEKTTESIVNYIGLMLRPNKNRRCHNQYPVPTNTMRSCITDFSALGLFEPSQRRHTVSDTNEYWTLTDIGREVYADIRRAMLEGRESESTSTDSAILQSDESQEDSV